MESERKPCSKCKINLPLSHYGQKRNEEYNMEKNYSAKRACEHRTNKYTCPKCRPFVVKTKDVQVEEVVAEPVYYVVTAEVK